MEPGWWLDIPPASDQVGFISLQIMTGSVTVNLKPIRALTLHQPWATAIANGPKRIENRKWKPPEWLIGERIWIHAGKHYDESAEDFMRDLWPDMPPRDLFQRGAIVGSARVDSFVMATPIHIGREWFVGPVGWVLKDVRPLTEPVEARGFQGLWTPTKGVEALCLRRDRPTPPRKGSKICPWCGRKSLTFGYGFAGGGAGPYFACVPKDNSDWCGYFHK